jgi:hypothetical protein
MLNKKTTSLQLTVLAMAVGLTLTATAFADGNENEHGYGHSATATRLYANPTGTAGQGQIEYTTSSTGSSIKAGITLPVGTTLLDSNAAVSAKVALVFPVANVTCNLRVEDIYLTYPKSPSTAAITESADYELSVKSVSGTPGTVTANAGNCYTTGTTTPAVVPGPISGDLVEVTLNGNPTTPPLTGIFK